MKLSNILIFHLCHIKHFYPQSKIYWIEYDFTWLKI